MHPCWHSGSSAISRHAQNTTEGGGTPCIRSRRSTTSSCACFFVCYAYQFAYIPLAWLPARKRQTPKPDPDHTFSVLIVAHDEAAVIGALVSIPLVMREQRTVLGAFRLNWPPFLAGIVLATGLSSLRLSALVNGLGFSIGTALYAFAPERWRSRRWCCRAFPVRLC